MYCAGIAIPLLSVQPAVRHSVFSNEERLFLRSVRFAPNRRLLKIPESKLRSRSSRTEVRLSLTSKSFR